MTHVVMLRSRNKDNQGLYGYKPRTKCFFVDYEKDYQKIQDKFEQFVDRGVPGETCRLYISINARNMERTRKKLIAALAMDDNLDLAKIESITVGLAMESDCAAEKHWLFDIDTTNTEEVAQFTADVKRIFADMPEDKCPEILSFEPTPNGYHMITSHGFDTRGLMARWGEVVDLHRDDFTILKVLTKP